MRSCIAVRHVAFEDLGLLDDLLAARGFSARHVDAGVDAITADTLLAPDLVVILGGPIGVYEEDAYPFLVSETAAIAARLARNRPTLGICLGAQLVAKALGAAVAPGPRKEIGWAPIELSAEGRASALAPLADTAVLHWHGDNLELPAGAVRLAATAACPNQAFAIGRHTLALQFHIEADPAKIERWLIGHCGELAAARIDPRVLRRDAVTQGPVTATAGRAVLGAWLDAAFAD
ncbi:glutamine amidotransferase [Xanthobacteraceae bacterium Astr-EGSB]|uniref:glutamine amidotransferase n=1 Tax=Astrobacterium formosum TaxID=3069710 RepID=UPI0027B32CE1|nr:glutamine amidotransferase [Xanthobacteraceae bacterium Astr-EGSB]